VSCQERGFYGEKGAAHRKDWQIDGSVGRSSSAVVWEGGGGNIMGRQATVQLCGALWVFKDKILSGPYPLINRVILLAATDQFF